MEEKRQEPADPREGQPEMPSDDEIFASGPADDAAYEDVFSALVDFESEPGLDDPGKRPDIGPRARRLHLHLDAFSNVQKILVVGIVATAAALTYVLANRTRPAPPPDWHAAPYGPPANLYGQAQHAATDLPAPGLSRPLGQARANDYSPMQAGVDAPEPSLPSPEPFSLQLANKLYVRRDFEHALVTFERLYERLGASEQNQGMRDFLLWRMALCNRNGGNVAQADSLLRTVSLSRLPILRALARYHQSTTLIERNRFVEAATRAYQTIALIEVIDHDPNWVSAVQQRCWFLVAEAMTRNVLSLSDADTDLPGALWGQHGDIDPFPEMDEPQLRVFLASGIDVLDQAVLSPQIRSLGGSGDTARWSVICNGASIEELLARFAANAKLNIRWTEHAQGTFTEDNLRRRPVYLVAASATAQQVATTATGSVGLLAQMDGRGNIHVLNPASYSSLADHTKMLTDESMSFWQRFLLTSQNDQRVPNAHFALGLLQAARGQFDEAIAEYKLVANRFPEHALSPHALFHSGKLKVRLRDYIGAHQDLKQLIELYPETELTDRACLHLAEATMKAGLYAEARDLYCRVYNLGLSIESQVESALGAGRCFYETGDYEETTKWLNRYITLARDQNRPEFHATCLLLGKTYLALRKPQQAHTALNLALKGDLSRQQHVETVTVRVRAYIEQGLYIDALGALEGTGGWQLSQQETIELLLLRTQVLRALGLVEKAIALLGEKGQFLPNPQLKCRVAVELAGCYTQVGDLESARKTLSEAFAQVGPGELAQQIGHELARVCLRLGQPAQAASVCSQLLAQAAPACREPILRLLTDAYREQGRYDLAIATMLEDCDEAGDPNGIEPSPVKIVTP